MEKWNEEMTQTLAFFESLPHAVQVDVAKRILVKVANSVIDELVGQSVPGESATIRAASTLAWMETRKMVMTESIKSIRASTERLLK